MTDLEYRAIGTGLENAVIEDMRPVVIAATKFMILTGWRRGEILGHDGRRSTWIGELLD
jgi:hypothetical protein